MAAVTSRALCLVRWYEVSRVLTASSTLATTQNYRNDSWSKTWRQGSQRNLSLTTKCFLPKVSPIFMKGSVDSKPTTTKSKSTVAAKNVDVTTNLATDNSETAGADVTVTYQRGLPKILVPLPSRKERCMFTLKPITHTVSDFLEMLKREDRGIDRAVIFTTDPENFRISGSNTIETLMEAPFRLQLNDNEYLVTPPELPSSAAEDMQKLSDVKILVEQLYATLNIREFKANLEKAVLTDLEEVRLQLEPLEQKFRELDISASRRSQFVSWAALLILSAQYGGLARLTWWEYSWDIMEPVTYFMTFGTSILFYAYYFTTKEEYVMRNVYNRRLLRTIYKRARTVGLDVNAYNALKDRAYELETTLKIIRGPLYDHMHEIQQKKREPDSESSSESSSPSSSPSPSPSRRNSPEKHVPKRTNVTHAGSKLGVSPQELKFR